MSNPSGLQKEHLVELVAENYNVLFERISYDGSDVSKEDIWALIAAKLNAMGSEKNVEEWKRCFFSLKYATNNKFLKITSPGGKTVKLSRVELKIIQICKIDPLNLLKTLDEQAVPHSVANALHVPQIFDDAGAENAPPTATENIDSQLHFEQGERSIPALDSHMYDNECAYVTDLEDPQTTFTDANVVDTTMKEEELPLSSQYTQSSRTDPSNRPDKERTNPPKTQLTKQQRSKTPLKQCTKPSQGTYATPLQREKLVQLVQEYFDALYGKLSNSSNGDIIKYKVWKIISSEVDAIGPKKNVIGWKRCFNTVKAATKEKLKKIRQYDNHNNQNKKLTVSLNPMDLKIIKMYSKDMLDGNKQLDELGIKKRSENSNMAATSSINSVVTQAKVPNISAEPFTQQSEEVDAINLFDHCPVDEGIYIDKYV